MSYYPRYSSSYRISREPAGTTYYTSSYVTPTYFSPGRSYTYTVPTRSYSYTVPDRSYTLPARTSYYSYGNSMVPLGASERTYERMQRVFKIRAPRPRNPYYRYI
ncbi:hypothetical protein FJT64_026006 [Amphibalanus amphitrite]|uniref:Uncharacterized protein n=1 Tax=Amphibalanus amphitrite TaxID=1232801 RepID=A0A6A4WI55_AMPAM|nr:hypothetical protein FJT64_026006 [Amphibalanus amphitrite]